jgi:hypothetical protein
VSYWFSQTNRLATATLEASSTAGGVVGYPLKEGSGAAVCATDGVYAGSRNRLYTVEIDAVADGTEVGQAKFRWKHSESASGWQATGLATSGSLLALDEGVKVKWLSGAGPDFALGDRWTFEATAPFGPGNLHDLDRDTVFRTAVLDNPAWLKADLGQAGRIRACLLLDHNFTAQATVTLQANTADSWTNPPYSQSLVVQAGLMALFLDQTYRYWRLTIADEANPAGYLSLSEWFLGDGLSPRLLAHRGWERGRDVSRLDCLPRETVSLELTAPDATQRDALLAWYDGLLSAGQRRLQPFFFCADTAAPAGATWLMGLAKPQLRHLQRGRDSYRLSLELIERERSNV